MVVTCKNCGDQPPDGALYCPRCGARVAPYSEAETKAYAESLQPSAGRASSDGAKGKGRRSLKGPLIGAGVGLVLGLVLGIGILSQPDAPSAPSQPLPPAGPTTTPTSQATAAPTTTPRTTAPRPVAYSFNGTGDTVTSSFTLPEGLFTVDLSHNGERNFIVHVISSDGADIESLANEIGDYDGTVALRVTRGGYGDLAPGQFVLEVMADGRWSVRITG